MAEASGGHRGRTVTPLGRRPLVVIGPGVVVPVLVVALALLVLAPALWPGFVLSHDMVVTPRQPLTWSALGAGDSLPRAVPVDAVVAVVSLVVPGALLQKLVLLGLLVASGLGAARLGGDVATAAGLPRRVAEPVAAACYLWNPYVAERLVLGHWALLVGYAVLPWLVRACRRDRDGRRGWARLLLLAALAALTPTGGLLAATVLVVCCRRRVGALLVAGAVNLPWVVPSLLHPVAGATAGGGTDGVEAFALRAESAAGPVVSALGLGGVWNADVVPDSRTTALSQGLSVAFAVLALLGAALLLRRARGDVLRLGVLWAVGSALALAPTWGPTARLVELAVVHVPGGGLLRDSHKWLALSAVALAVLAAAVVAAGVRALVGRAPGQAAGSVAVAAAGTAVVCALLTVPDLAWGAAGRLGPVRYPADWAAAARVLEHADRSEAVLSLPFQPLRAFPWNGGRALLDPAPRWLRQEVLVDDRLTVGGTTLPPEGPRVAAAAAALGSPDPAVELRGLGVRWVLVARTTPGAVPASLGSASRTVLDGPELRLVRLDGPVPTLAPPRARRAAVVATDVLVLVVLAGAGATLAARRDPATSEETALEAAVRGGPLLRWRKR